MLAVVGLAVEVARAGWCPPPPARRPRRSRPARRPRQRLLDRRRPHRRRPHVGQRDPGLGDRAVVAADRGGDADDRPRLRDPVELLVVVAPAGSELGHPHLDEHLVRRDAPSAGSRRRTPTPGPSGGRRLPAITSSASSASATAGRSPAGSACASDAAERATVPDRRVGDRRRRLGEQAGVLLHQRVVHDVVVGRHRADDEVVAVVADPAHLLDPADVDHDVGVGQPQPQQRDAATARRPAPWRRRRAAASAATASSTEPART